MRCPSPVMICKPGLDSQELMDYFKSSLAREKNEILLAVEWGICQLPSCFLCGIEAGLFVSNSSLYLMEVTAQSSNSQWTSKSLPLRLVVQASLEELCQVTSGAGDQYLLFELGHRISIHHFAIFLPTSEHTVNVVANLKAALDSVSVGYDDVSSSQRSMCLTMESRVLFVTADGSNTRHLKGELVRDRVSMESVNCTPIGEFVSIDSELDVKKASSKVAITHHMVCWEMVSDVIPSSTSVCSLQLRALVMTQDGVYLCREDVLSPLVMGSIPLCPPSLLSYVLDFRPISEVACIKECNKANLSLSPSNPLYQFSIAFSGGDTTAGGGSMGEWVFCVPNSQLMDQFISSLDHAWRGLHGSPLPHVHTPVPLLVLEQGPRPPLPQEGGDRWGPRFYHNRALLELCTSSYDKKVEFFKEHVALAKFDKSNEGCLAFFMARCSPSHSQRTEIEALVVASNYAVYLVSTSDDIHTWCEAGWPTGVDPLQRIGEKGGGEGGAPRCFHRIWLSDIKEVGVGLFYLSVQLNTAGGGTPNKEGVVIIPQLAASTLALLGAISKAVDLRDTAEEQVRSDILAEFEDLGDHPIVKRIAGSKLHAKSAARFRQPHLADGDKLRCLLEGCFHKTEWSSLSGLQVLGQQVMLFGEVHVPSDVTPPVGGHPPCHPHLVLLTNRGLYMCSNDSYTHHSPAVFRAQQLRVKRWCPIEQVGHIEVTMSEHGIRIHLQASQVTLSHKLTPTHQVPRAKHAITQIDQPKHGSVHPDQSTHNLVPPPTIHLIAQNSELVSSFVYLLSLLWREKNGGKALAATLL